MDKLEKEKIGLIILDTLKEYLHDIDTPCWSGEVIEDFDFDNIADDLINKLFIHKHDWSICPNCGCGNLKKTYDGYWCKMCKTEI